jgi:hypothetical protein
MEVLKENTTITVRVADLNPGPPEYERTALGSVSGFSLKVINVANLSLFILSA